ncbi:MAG: ABC transporter substrate-binding protein [Desulfarculus sp.]|nr:ABC transporter substrate-binding protein [Desulfarculus sp.]
MIARWIAGARTGYCQADLSAKGGSLLSPRHWLLGGVLLLALACSPPEPLRLGFVGGLSGRVADLGLAGRDGAQLAVDLRNQGGGVAGRRVVLLVKDDGQDPGQARRAAQALLDQGVAALIGPMTSDMAMAVAPLMNQAQVVCVSPTATTEALSGLDDHFFRVTSTTRAFARANALYQIKTQRMRRVAAAYDTGNRSFSENWLENFNQALAEGGGQVVARVAFKSGEDVSYAEVAGQLLAPRPDGVLIVANSMDSALLCQQIRKTDPSLPITLSDWGANERLVELGGKAVEGVTVVQTFLRDSDSPRYQEFRRAYLERFGREPGFAGVYAFEAANLVLEALERRGQAGGLKQTILAMRRFEGLQGPFILDEYGDVRRPQASISEVKGGKFQVIE